MDDAPRAAIKALVGITGLLVFCGAGCAAQTSSSSQQAAIIKSEDSIATSSTMARLTLCSLEQARAQYPSFQGWKWFDEMRAEEGRDGWSVEKFCFDQNRGSIFILAKDSNRNDDVPRAQFMLGTMTEGITVASPFKIAASGQFNEHQSWEVQWEGKKALATARGDDLSASWRATFLFDPEEGTFSDQGVCAETLFDTPDELKNQQLKPCKN